MVMKLTLHLNNQIMWMQTIPKHIPLPKRTLVHGLHAEAARCREQLTLITDATFMCKSTKAMQQLHVDLLLKEAWDFGCWSGVEWSRRLENQAHSNCAHKLLMYRNLPLNSNKTANEEQSTSNVQKSTPEQQSTSNEEQWTSNVQKSTPEQQSTSNEEQSTSNVQKSTPEQQSTSNEEQSTSNVHKSTPEQQSTSNEEQSTSNVQQSTYVQQSTSDVQVINVKPATKVVTKVMMKSLAKRPSAVKKHRLGTQKQSESAREVKVHEIHIRTLHVSQKLKVCIDYDHLHYCILYNWSFTICKFHFSI
jgi:DNA polymerase III gamma/tau subunit